jgi:uncharacterized protein YndB with AHSA1/START domain
MNLAFSVNRTVLIEAGQETVFSFFTDRERWAAWWGAGSTVDARVGGAIKIRHSNGFESCGEVLEIDSPNRFVFTYSLQTARVIPPEESRVTLTLESRGTSTLVSVLHEVADKSVSELLPQGWRFHFSLFANAVADLINANAPAMASAWFALWDESDASRRAAKLREVACEHVRFHDRYSYLDGIDEVVVHIGASQKFMPGVRLEQRGPLRQCLGTALADWIMRGKDGNEMMSGTNVFVFGPQGKLASVTGIMNSK